MGRFRPIAVHRHKALRDGCDFLSGEGLVCRFKGTGRSGYKPEIQATMAQIGGCYHRAKVGDVIMKHEFLDRPDGMALIAFETSGESIVAESGAMVARDTGIEMKTNMRGGLASALKRKVLGSESLFLNTFTATAPGQALPGAPRGRYAGFQLGGGS